MLGNENLAEVADGFPEWGGISGDGGALHGTCPEVVDEGSHDDWVSGRPGIAAFQSFPQELLVDGDPLAVRPGELLTHRITEICDFGSELDRETWTFRASLFENENRAFEQLEKP